VVANAGTTVYGLVLEANSARRGSGTAQLKLQLTQIVINRTAIPIVADVFDSRERAPRAAPFAASLEVPVSAPPLAPLLVMPGWVPLSVL
jgi:hypothetical protein